MYTLKGWLSICSGVYVGQSLLSEAVGSLQNTAFLYSNQLFCRYILRSAGVRVKDSYATQEVVCLVISTAAGY